MFKNIALTSLAVAGVSATAVLGSANMASAASFNFSFSNVEGAVAGTVQGTLVLPDGDGTFAATSVIVTSAPAALGYTLPFDVLANFTNVLENTFTVVGGVIDPIASSFGAFVAPPPGILGSAFGLNNAGFGGSVFNIPLSADPFTGVADAASSTLTYSPASSASVPEPSTLLGLLAVGSLGALTRKGKG